MTLQEAFTDFTEHRLEKLKSSSNADLLKRAGYIDDALNKLLDSTQSELYFELQKVELQIKSNDELDAYKAGFIDGLTLYRP